MIIAIPMLFLVCVGLAGLVGFVIWTQINRAQEQAVTLPPTVTPLQPTFTPTSTPTATPTETPLPTPTGTLVVGNNGEPAAAPANGNGPGEGEPVEEEPLQIAPTDTPNPNATPTNTLVLQPSETATPNVTPGGPPAAEMPAGGGVLPTARNSYLIWVGIGVLLLLILGIYNYLRRSSPEV